MNDQAGVFRDSVHQNEDLRTAMALNRAMAELKRIETSFAATSEHDKHKLGKRLDDLFLEIHHNLYVDTAREVIQPAPADRTAVRKAIQELTSNGRDPAHPHALFDQHGFVYKHGSDVLVEVLAEFYDKMRKIRPFGEGNKLTLDVFMVALCKMPGFKEKYKDLRIDFRRLDAEDIEALSNEASKAAAVKTAFTHAIDASREIESADTPNGFRHWPNNSTYIEGIPFLTQQSEKYGACLVTVNGGLVPIKAILPRLEDGMGKNRHLVDYAFVKKADIVEYLEDREENKALGDRNPLAGFKEKSSIDGYTVTGDKVPLFCIDIDTITGLRSHDRIALDELIRQSGELNETTGKHKTIFDLNKREDFRDRLIAQATTTRLKSTIAIAYKHVNNATDSLDEYVREVAFTGKHPVEKPKLILSMGGAGTGKSIVEKSIVPATCDDNCVKASLDGFREASDLYKVLLSANHHSDDYFAVDSYALTLRDWVAKKAMAENYNLFYDGTGIDYDPRYKNLVSEFKKAGYQTEVMAVDAPLPKAIDRVGRRFDNEHRALPWKVVIGKHIKFPRSFIQAVEDSNMDKISLVVNDEDRDADGKGRERLIAETFTLPADELRDLKTARGTGLSGRLSRLMTDDGQGVLHRITAAQNEYIAESAALREGSYLAYQNMGDKTRVLAIYDVKRFKDFMNKALMNPEASCPADLNAPTSDMHFLMDAARPWAAKVAVSVVPPQAGI